MLTNLNAMSIRRSCAWTNFDAVWLPCRRHVLTLKSGGRYHTPVRRRTLANAEAIHDLGDAGRFPPRSARARCRSAADPTSPVNVTTPSSVSTSMSAAFTRSSSAIFALIFDVTAADGDSLLGAVHRRMDAGCRAFLDLGRSSRGPCRAPSRERRHPPSRVTVS